MPAALDPTTISSLNQWNQSRHSQHDPPTNLVSTSPSTSFAKLSLLSPVVPALSPLAASGSLNRSSLSPHQSWSPLRHDGTNDTAVASVKGVESRGEDTPVPSQGSDPSMYFPESDPHIASKLRFASPESSLLPISFERRPVSRESPFPPDDIVIEPQPSPESPHPHCESPTVIDRPPLSPSRIPSPEEDSEQPRQSVVTPPPTQPAFDRTPPRSTPTPPVAAPTPPPPSPPPPPKVKLSLKDFAMRKKKQREEMAKHHSSPTSTHSAPGARSPPRTSGEDVEMASEDTNGVEEVHAAAEVGSTVEYNVGSNLNGHLHPEPQRDLTDQLSEAESSMMPDRHHSPPLAPNLMRPRSPSPHLPNGINETHPYEVTRQAKVELIEQPIPNGVPTIDSKENSNLSPSPPFTLNGTAKVIDLINAAPRTASPSPPPLGSRGHSRRLSQEDGEIPSTGSDTPPPPKQKQHLFTTFVPRSHTPPTQPRSFHTAPASPSVSTPSPSAPIPTSVRRSQNPYSPVTHSTQVHRGTAPGSRPLPSGPRALRVGIPYGQHPGNTLPNRFNGPQFIPRGPSADRERMEWDRERVWPRSRGRGAGSGAGTGWGR